MNITVKRINRRALELSINDNGETFVCRVNHEAQLADVIRKYTQIGANGNRKGQRGRGVYLQHSYERNNAKGIEGGKYHGR